jgi:Tfp pilus assembly protein PilX
MLHTSKRKTTNLTRNQGGAALFMALIFLLVLTVLGVFGMNLSRLENLMAGNTQYQTQALNNAEYVLIAAENDIKTVAGNPFDPDVAGDHYYPKTTTDYDSSTSGTQQPTDLIWSFDHATVTLPDINGDGIDTDGDGNADDGIGAYVIQDGGTDLTEAESKSVEDSIMNPLAGAVVQVFLVSAQSGAARGAKRILQSVVVTDPL